MRLSLEEFMALLEEDPDDARDYVARVGGFSLLLEAIGFIRILREERTK